MRLLRSLIPTTFYQILVENIFKDWKHLQAKTHKQYEDKQKEHNKEATKSRMDSDMYETQIEENKTTMQKMQAEEDQRKELQNKVVRLDQIVDILIKLKSELEAREKYAAELEKRKQRFRSKYRVASAMHINEAMIIV